jgi:hypothetical protein
LQQVHDFSNTRLNLSPWDEGDPVTTPKDKAALDFGGPATYLIVVQGTVSENWRGRLGGMEVTTASQETGEPQTTLRGRLRDQAALHGLLETLYALHLPILEMKKVDSACDQDAGERGGPDHDD